MPKQAPLAARKNIAELTYVGDARGCDRLCYPGGGAYTGMVFEALPSGSLTAEYEVRDGLRHGADKQYYSEGCPESVAHYRQGFLHGEVVYFYPEGTPKEKSVFEYDILTEEFQWDEAGNLLHHRAIEATDSSFGLLERRRQEYRW